VNARRHSVVWTIVLAVSCGPAAMGQTGADRVRSGNALYQQGQYDQALTQYDKALIEDPRLDQARFNKANTFFRMDDLAGAMDLYNEVSAGTRDMDLVKKAKTNLGNAYFQRGLKQRDSDLQKAVDDIKTSIGLWRAVLDLDPNHEKARRNKEVAGLALKDILDQMKKQQKQADPNQAQQDQGGSSQQRQDGGGQQDPNQTQGEGRPKPDSGNEPKAQQSQDQPDHDPNQTQEPNTPSPPRDPNAGPRMQEQVQASDRTAQEILDKEQQRNKERQVQVRTGHVPVDKDW